ncbi:hypothetical protein GCM10023172_38640 [Hymenobacter ginsengisoli]|uniref:Uncharacterized protein n=1 Tax=Hymenobacter ginsengisoli TaxID=1051626 RepID=A0ABP8QQG2_9BACT|nr:MULTISPECIES: DUF6678 family protein [unclassified Hymenobacter]MBO2033001.1 hypothetical protein [Hymenobacter sp. BT559]
MNISALVDIIQAAKCTARIKIKGRLDASSWSWIIIPVPSYIELGSVGPWPVRDVEWVEINPVTMEHTGRLIPPKRIDNIAQIEEGLRQANIDYTTLDGIVHIPLLKAVF